MGKILTTKELAKYLKLTEVTIYKYIKEGKIPSHRVGSRWRFDKDQIDGSFESLLFRYFTALLTLQTAS